MIRWSITIMALFVGAVSAGGQPQAPEPPRVNQPPDFSQIVGTFQIAAQAAPTAVAVEEPLTLTVTISGQADAPYVPKRDLLRVFPDDMQRDFFVEPLAEKAGKGSWEFTYRLRPKHTRVQFVPSLKLVYYARQRRYQTTYSDAIPLTVKPRPEPVVEVVGLTVVQAPRSFLELAEEHAAPQRVAVQRSPWQLGLLLGPPALCFTGAWWWRRRQTWRAERLRERRRALEKLLIKVKDSSDDLAATASLVAAYLRSRLDIPAEEPTPAELERWMKRRGVSKPTRQEWRQFLQSCDAARFSPSPPGASAVHGVVPLIHALEEEPCLAAR